MICAFGTEQLNAGQKRRPKIITDKNFGYSKDMAISNAGKTQGLFTSAIYTKNQERIRQISSIYKRLQRKIINT